jgi:YD repeat-containing protein
MTDTLSSEGRTTYVYDAAHRLTTISRSVDGTQGPRVIYTYDNADRLTSIVRTINGADPKVATTLSYDNADRLTTIAHGKIANNPNPPPSGYIYTPLATLVYSYDSGGRLATENNAEGLATYSYDDTNQLTGVDRPGGGSDESFGYDANGNRNTSGYTVATGNRITSGGGYTFTYDAERNTSAKTQLNGAGTGDDVVTTFSYDHKNRLTGATEKTGGTLTMRATYTYDALGRRIKTDVDARGAGGGAVVLTWHVYDGDNTHVDFDSGGTVTMRHPYGPAIDELLAHPDSGGTSAWYLTDRLGTVRDIVSTAAVSLTAPTTPSHRSFRNRQTPGCPRLLRPFHPDTSIHADTSRCRTGPPSSCCNDNNSTIQEPRELKPRLARPQGELARHTRESVQLVIQAKSPHRCVIVRSIPSGVATNAIKKSSGIPRPSARSNPSPGPPPHRG